MSCPQVRTFASEAALLFPTKPIGAVGVLSVVGQLIDYARRFAASIANSPEFDRIADQCTAAALQIFDKWDIPGIQGPLELLVKVHVRPVVESGIRGAFELVKQSLGGGKSSEPAPLR